MVESTQPIKADKVKYLASHISISTVETRKKRRRPH